jgi:hypothetical protein
MAVRLRAAGTPRWLDLPHGVRVQVRPVTSAVVAAAQSAGRRRLSALSEEERADADWLAGLAFATTVAEIARLSILAWEGVQDDAGAPAPVTAEAVEALMQQDDLAFAFWVAATATLHEVVTEGNG